MSELERDVLIARVVDAEAGEGDWAALRAMGERDPAVWRELAEAQLQAAALARGVGEAVAIADRVDAPTHAHDRLRPGARLRRGSAWLGWAVAAGLTLAWGTGGLGTSPGAGPGSSASLVPGLGSAEDAYKRYLDLGQQQGFVVGEMPTQVLIHAQPVEDGVYEVTYLRQIIEKARVRGVYGVGEDELGQPVRIPIQPAGGPV